MSDEATALLEIRNLSKSYTHPRRNEERVVLDRISLLLNRGESIGIMGPSGSGKSTLLNMIGLLDQPDSGDVLIEGKSLSGLDDEQAARLRNRKIGFVFQAHHLLPQCSVLENVLVPTIPLDADTDEVNERARQLIDRVGLGDRCDQRPGQLSGGECQRVAVVRALINRPVLVLADEPTGSLDGGTAEEVGTMLVELNREENFALLTVTHSRDLAAMMASTRSLNDGRLED